MQYLSMRFIKLLQTSIFLLFLDYYAVLCIHITIISLKNNTKMEKYKNKRK